MDLRENVVALAHTETIDYTAAAEVVGRALELLGLPAALASVIPEGSRVAIKPNWVLHENRSGHGLECLVTHPALIEAVVRYAAKARPASIVIGDAPVQGCDFDRLLQECGIPAMVESLRADGIEVSVVDFRRTVLDGDKLGQRRTEGLRDASQYIVFDVGKDSLLEPVSGDADKFRVTMYNPDLLLRTHAPGRHQYLIAREVIDADVVINLPKLKTHKKAGITGALKNLIGINGNKEYLPHHRKGGSELGGDCYAGRSRLKLYAENLLDAANRSSGGWQALLARSGEKLAMVAAKMGDNVNLEGAWFGNDTIWRTCLDLQRVLRYGGADGRLHKTPQRTVLTITDAIVGGEGDGPLANTPVLSGFVTAGLSTAAVEWVNARLMGIDPEKIPVVRESFGRFSWPLVDFDPDAIEVRLLAGRTSVDGLGPATRPFRMPSGWEGHCEVMEQNRDATVA